MVLTKEEKLRKYRAGQYMFRPPPVPAALWTADDWILFIDRHGVWL